MGTDVRHVRRRADPGGDADGVRIRLLGPLDVAVDGRPVALTAPKQRALLAGLALHAGRAQPVHDLVELLWDDPPATAVKTLQTYVSDVRHALDGGLGSRDLLRFTPDGYRLEVPRGAVDGLRFEELAADGYAALDAGAVEQGTRTLRAALGLWRGDHIEALPDTVAAGIPAYRLEELRWEVLETVVEFELDRGRADQLVPEVRAALAQHPLRERLWAALMRALAATGRRADALLAYRDACATMGHELGIEPSPPLQELAARIVVGGGHPTLNGAGDRLPTSEPPWPTPGPAVTPPAPLLVGRTFQCEALAREWRRTTAGERAVAVLTGRSGSGRTALLSWLVEQALPDGAWVLVARCTAHAPDPYAPLPELVRWVRHHGDRLPPTPGLVELLGDPPDAVPAPADVAHALGTWLEQRPDGVPVLLAVDDLHLAQPETAEAVLHLAGSALPRTAAIVATAGSVGRSFRTVRLISALRAESHVVVVELPPLTARDIRPLLGTQDGTPRDEFRPSAATVLRETAGIPRLVRALLDQSDPWQLDDSHGPRPANGHGVRPPVRILDAARRMLRDLGPDGEELAGRAAALPAVFTAADLARTARRPRDEVDQFIARARAAGVIEQRHGGLSVHPPLLRAALAHPAFEAI